MLEMEHTILGWIQQIHNPVLDWIMKFITTLGDNGYVWIAVALALLCFRKTRKFGAMMSVSLVLCLLIGNLGLKLLIDRPRPFHIDDTIRLLIEAPLDSSFPSGHTMSSFASACVLFFWNKKAGIAGIILASLIAFSRMYLYVHYPTDILAGAVLGIGCAFGALYLHKFVEKHFSKRHSKE